LPVDRDTLAKVLALELKKGCRDTAVVGGLDKFLATWLKENPQTRPSPVPAFPAGKTGYASLSLNQRKCWLDEFTRQLQKPAPEPDAAAAPKTIRAAPRRPKKPPVEAAASGLDGPVSTFKGISTSLAERLSKLGVKTIRDFLYLFPHRHLDYSHLKTISQLAEGHEETVIANTWEARRINIKGRPSTEAVLGDSTGNVRAVWFNNPYLARQLVPGREIVLSGRVRYFSGRPVFESPDWELYEPEEGFTHTGRLVPVYPLTRGLFQRQLRKLAKGIVEAYSPLVTEFLPEAVIRRNRMLPAGEALRQAHFPNDLTLKDRARFRLAFNELFLLQLGVLQKKRSWQINRTRPIPTGSPLLEAFLGSLPFELTGAQQRVIKEIFNDLASSTPMSRLLQGEVGSGKTIVALASLLSAVAAGRQGAFMAPTEILAQQHFKAVTGLLGRVFETLEADDFLASFRLPDGTILQAALLTSDIKNSTKKNIKSGVKAGTTRIIVGTHAIIQDEVSFADLALAVIDEQHRFGVVQRQALREKGSNPHILVMTATPIPRTLALTLYGDLDLSVIDELPPGRQVIKTRWLNPDERYKAYNFIRRQVGEGRQVFIICPLVEESDSLQAKAATVEFERLSSEVFPQLRLGLLHGRMKAAEKEAVMRRYYQGLLDILVATPVVEVGIDVPNATVILIESASRFGLSQLHQFRGRVGRGEHQSYCILIAETSSESGAERLKAIEELQDGFKLAEKDLELRGPGEFFGTRQSGLPDLKMARISDTALLETARREAMALFEKDPDLTQAQHTVLREELRRTWSGEQAERS